MESKREIFKAFLDGKKMQFVGWRPDGYIYMDKTGRIIGNLHDLVVDNTFENPEKWSVYEEPKPDFIAIESYRELFVYLLCNWEIKHVAWEGRSIRLGYNGILVNQNGNATSMPRFDKPKDWLVVANKNKGE
jgi:hypothetical protein